MAWSTNSIIRRRRPGGQLELEEFARESECMALMDQTFDDVSIQIAAATQQLASIKADVSARAAATPEWLAALVHKLEALERTNGVVASAFEKAKATYFEQQTHWARLPRPDTPKPPS